ncbi:BspA family leucine-rich repeat surface protein [Helicobacter mehlei]|uniref:BspA family leucine-rich repeat surface protein n=1 Tax=Helicobacter mehlei TaxID=2316080 RepID=UPI000EB50783|nr:BspA family leucine-rich repeat surface protein [Helicobacter mehlei]
MSNQMIKRYFPKTNAALKALVKDESVHLGEIDVHAVEDMSFVFSNHEFDGDGGINFNADFERQNFRGLETWDVSHVKNMARMFCGLKYFNHDISNWDVSSVTNMHSMFRVCIYFNQPLEKWDVSKVTNMHKMFLGCLEFNQSLENWDVSSVGKMMDMFSGCDVLEKLPKWYLKRNKGEKD